MRKIGLIAAIVGFALLAAGLWLRVLNSMSSWLWVPGFSLLSGGSALFLWARATRVAPVVPASDAPTPVGTDTARLLDNFEQRFAELKGRKANATVLMDLYTLGTQLEQRGRVVQATAVYRHLARIRQYLPGCIRPPAAPHGCRARQSEAGRAAVRRRRCHRRATAGTRDPQRGCCGCHDHPTGHRDGRHADRRAGAEEASRQNGEPQRLGRYQLEREIGRGAMGVVYLGRDTAINRVVAIKAIPLASEFSECRTHRSENAGSSEKRKLRDVSIIRTSSPSTMWAKSVDLRTSRWNI